MPGPCEDLGAATPCTVGSSALLVGYESTGRRASHDRPRSPHHHARRQETDQNVCSIGVVLIVLAIAIILLSPRPSLAATVPARRTAPWPQPGGDAFHDYGIATSSMPRLEPSRAVRALPLPDSNDAADFHPAAPPCVADDETVWIVSTDRALAQWRLTQYDAALQHVVSVTTAASSATIADGSVSLVLYDRTTPVVSFMENPASAAMTPVLVVVARGQRTTFALGGPLVAPQARLHPSSGQWLLLASAASATPCLLAGTLARDGAMQLASHPMSVAALDWAVMAAPDVVALRTAQTVYTWPFTTSEAPTEWALPTLPDGTAMGAPSEMHLDPRDPPSLTILAANQVGILTLGHDQNPLPSPSPAAIAVDGLPPGSRIAAADAARHRVFICTPAGLLVIGTAPLRPVAQLDAVCRGPGDVLVFSDGHVVTYSTAGALVAYEIDSEEATDAAAAVAGATAEAGRDGALRPPMAPPPAIINATKQWNVATSDAATAAVRNRLSGDLVYGASYIYAASRLVTPITDLGQGGSDSGGRATVWDGFVPALGAAQSRRRRIFLALYIILAIVAVAGIMTVLVARHRVKRFSTLHDATKWVSHGGPSAPLATTAAGAMTCSAVEAAAAASAAMRRPWTARLGARLQAWRKWSPRSAASMAVSAPMPFSIYDTSRVIDYGLRSGMGAGHVADLGDEPSVVPSLDDPIDSTTIAVRHSMDDDVLRYAPPPATTAPPRNLEAGPSHDSVLSYASHQSASMDGVAVTDAAAAAAAAASWQPAPMVAPRDMMSSQATVSRPSNVPFLLSHPDDMESGIARNMMTLMTPAAASSFVYPTDMDDSHSPPRDDVVPTPHAWHRQQQILQPSPPRPDDGNDLSDLSDASVVSDDGGDNDDDDVDDETGNASATGGETWEVSQCQPDEAKAPVGTATMPDVGATRPPVRPPRIGRPPPSRIATRVATHVAIARQAAIQIGGALARSPPTPSSETSHPRPTGFWRHLVGAATRFGMSPSTRSDSGGDHAVMRHGTTGTATTSGTSTSTATTASLATGAVPVDTIVYAASSRSAGSGGGAKRGSFSPSLSTAGGSDDGNSPFAREDASPRFVVGAGSEGHVRDGATALHANAVVGEAMGAAKTIAHVWHGTTQISARVPRAVGGRPHRTQGLAIPDRSS
ncbi:hypothetical protein CXG81DRAFT_16468 [Caulochytrium protostelioides]|uniref:Uncharacterized protein n=1 Tax=Caulochytrium protostelioides TaxID=1555241 RepID=A0A4P9XFM9_9FUNG|nr:hypothetical protein CXG81DRAFT_16468 [Caulochytrium protostelioides]|eukprot:RKP04041.1 hypothetical protein CXG81DRAFT_16468 [Caulochytrium protostelioides]